MWFVNSVSSRELLGFLFVLRCGRNVESTGRRPGSLIREVLAQQWKVM